MKLLAIVTSHFEISRLEKEKDNLKFQISRIQQLYEKSQEMAQSQVRNYLYYNYLITFMVICDI